MTDAAVPVTEQAVEQFVELYLKSLGAEITKDGRQWTIDVSSGVDTNLELDGASLEVADDPNAVSEDAFAVAPESPFIERLLQEAANQTPLGSLSLTADQVELKLPGWLTDSQFTVVDKSFTPYYDRRAVCVLFDIGIETVSEYQQDELRAIAIDLNDHEQRPQLAETYLNAVAELPQEITEARSADKQTLTNAFDTAQATLKSELSSTVHKIQEQATRAAEVELDEYRQFVRQRRDELTDEIDRMRTRIDETTETVDAVSQQNDRLEALRKRKRLQSELDELRDELDSVTTQIDTGFQQKRNEIRERHSITVRTRPVAATAVSYERGDLELELRQDTTPVTKAYSYAIGAGIISKIPCEQCGQQLSDNNCGTLVGEQVIGASCCGE